MMVCDKKIKKSHAIEEEWGSNEGKKMKMGGWSGSKSLYWAWIALQFLRLGLIWYHNKITIIIREQGDLNELEAVRVVSQYLFLLDRLSQPIYNKYTTMISPWLDIPLIGVIWIILICYHNLQGYNNDIPLGMIWVIQMCYPNL